MNWKIQDNIQPLQFWSNNNRAYDFLNYLNWELNITSRTDLRALEFQKNKTATEVLQQWRSMNAHIDAVATNNEINSEWYYVELIIQIAKRFLNTRPYDEKTQDYKDRVINTQWYIVNQPWWWEPKFIEKTWIKSKFSLTKEVVNTDVEVVVKDSRWEKASNLEKIWRLLQMIPMIWNLVKM
jgi:hypothetical protein